MMRKTLTALCGVMMLMSMVITAHDNAHATVRTATVQEEQPSRRRVLRTPQTRRRRVQGDRARNRSIGSAYRRGGRYYARGGKRLARGTVRSAKNVGRAKPIVAGRELGKGAGGFGADTARGTAQVGVGTARVGKKVGRTTRNAARKILN